MTYTRIRSAIAVIAVAIAGLAFAAAIDTADADSKDMDRSERLVVRGDATILDGTPGPDGIPLQIVDGSFRGTPVGTGGYEGSILLKVADAFPNGEGGVCAPIRGEIVLGTGSPDRLVLSVKGSSCQDGSGPPPLSTFTGLAEFVVKQGTGKYAGAHGSGLMTSSEDAADRDSMTLVGRITR